MKFEHLLQLYWTKGFLFGGKLFLFSYNKQNFISNITGLNLFFYLLILKRFELNLLFLDKEFVFKQLSADELKIINMFLTRIMTVNNNIFDWSRLTTIRLYLIKTYKGRCHAIGKPVHGQRTWSNAWTSYKYNKVIRMFINKTLKSKKDEQQQLTFNIVQKKKKTKKKKNILIPIKNQIFIKKKHINFWF